jgi:putative redox protein
LPYIYKKTLEEVKIIASAEGINSSGAYKTVLKSHDHYLIGDEPISAGGSDAGPSPGDYVCMSLAACKAITLRMYTQRKNWDAGEIQVKVSLVKSMSNEGPVHSFLCELSASGNLTPEQKDRMVQIAKACPISKLLSKGSEVKTVML